MARRGNSSRGQRDDISPSLENLLAPDYDAIAPVRPLTLNQIWSETYGSRLDAIEDGRRFTPQVLSPRSVSGAAARIAPVPSRSRPRDVPFRNAFTPAEYTVRCVRRKKRREVIFALRKRGKGAGARRRRRNFWSNVGC